MVRIRICAIFTLFLLSLFALASSAQEIPGISSPATIVPTSQLPRPRESVTLNLQSFNLDLNKSLITWTVDGKIVLRGTGMRSATVVAGELGTKKSVVATISTDDGEYVASFNIVPGELSLLWEAATYVPPFYKGKALHSHGGLYKVTVVPALYSPSGKLHDPKTLIYTWKKNGAIDSAYSGYGKSSYTGSHTSFIREGDEISVDIASSDGSSSATKSVIIAPVTPEAHLYEDSPLYGIRYEKSLADTIFLFDEEISLAAEPYFFSTKDKTSSILSFDWAINDNPVVDFSGRESITLRRPQGGAGAAQVAISIGNSYKLLQGANHNLIIRYDQAR